MKKKKIRGLRSSNLHLAAM